MSDWGSLVSAWSSLTPRGNTVFKAASLKDAAACSPDGSVQASSQSLASLLEGGNGFSSSYSGWTSAHAFADVFPLQTANPGLSAGPFAADDAILTATLSEPDLAQESSAPYALQHLGGSTPYLDLVVADPAMDLGARSNNPTDSRNDVSQMLSSPASVQSPVDSATLADLARNSSATGTAAINPFGRAVDATAGTEAAVSIDPVAASATQFLSGGNFDLSTWSSTIATQIAALRDPFAPFRLLVSDEDGGLTGAASATSAGTGAGSTGGSSTPPSSTLVGSASGLQIKLVWDSSVASAPTGFETAAISAATNYTTMFSNKEMITINVGYGEAGGVAVKSGAASQSQYTGAYVTYASLRPALLGDAGSSSLQQLADSSLPTTNPLGNIFYFLTLANAKALGLTTNTITTDGSVGLSTKYTWDFDTSNGMTAGSMDAVGAFAHEIGEVMGRVASVGTALGSRIYTPLDLFRYSAPVTRDTTYNFTGAYFSIDKGVTKLGVYNNPVTTGADAGDWSTAAGGDSFGWFAPGRAAPVTSNDLVETASLGYGFTSAGLSAVASVTQKFGLA